MPIELKLAISLFAVGISNLLLAGNRNWVFGYRSPRAIKTHKSYAFANRVWGVGMSLVSAAYYGLIAWYPNVYEQYPEMHHVILVTGYFAFLVFLIEFGLYQRSRK